MSVDYNINLTILNLFKNWLSEYNLADEDAVNVTKESLSGEYADEFESFFIEYFGESSFEKLKEMNSFTNENEIFNEENQAILEAIQDEIEMTFEEKGVDYTSSSKAQCNITSINKLEDINLTDIETNILNKLFGFEDKANATDEKQLEAETMLGSLIDDNQGITADKIKILQEYIGDLTKQNLSEDDIVKTIKMLDGNEDILSKEDFQELAKLIQNKGLQAFLEDAGIESNESAEAASNDATSAGGGTNSPASAEKSLENMSLEELEAELNSAKQALNDAIKSADADLAQQKTTCEENLKNAQTESQKLTEEINTNTTKINTYQSEINSNTNTISNLQAQINNAKASENNEGNPIDVTGLENQIAELNTRNQELAKEIEALEEKNKELETSKQEQEQLITQYTNELTQIETKISTLATSNEQVKQAQDKLNSVQAMYDKRKAEQAKADEVEILDVNTNAKDLRESEDLSNLPLTYELDGVTYHCPKFAAYDTDGNGTKDFQINSWEEFQRYALNAGICNVGKYGSMQCQNASAWYLQFALGVADLNIVNAMKEETQSSNATNDDTAGYMTTTIGEEPGKNQRYLMKVLGDRDQSYEIIVNELKNGRPCVVSVPGGSSAHYVLAMGISDNGYILIMDSYDCSMKKLGYANSQAYAKGDKQHRNLATRNGVLIFSNEHTYLYGDNGDHLKNEDYWETSEGDADYRNWLAIWNSPNAKSLLKPGGRFSELGEKYGRP